MKSFNFCNNCGKTGHVFQQCKIPITSMGVITCHYDDDAYKLLMICRKDSLGYVDFIRGRYGVDNKKYIMNMINIMTVTEKHRLKTRQFQDLWNELWGSFVGIQYRGEESLSQKKFNQLKQGISINNETYTLDSLIDLSTTTWEEPEWGFPKGRRNYQEKDQACAMREWVEETGYKNCSIDIIENLLPFEENFTGSNYKSYKHKYYLGYMKQKNNDTPNFQKTEVSKLKWATFQEAEELIRPYNLEKIKIVKKIKKVLEQYTLYR